MSKQFFILLSLAIYFGAAQGSLLLGASIPEINYRKSGDRTLIYVNNPEQLLTEDLGDVSASGGRIIMRAENVRGRYRNFFEHVNRTGFVIGYGIRLCNPNDYAVEIVISGSGFETSINGGRPFSQLFSAYAPKGTANRFVVGPYETFWLMRRDQAVNDRSFFSGVIDFTVRKGAVIVDNIAYREFSAIDETASYMGYIQRIEADGTNEARVYKGLSPYTEVVASRVNFTIDDHDPQGVLAVKHQTYNLLTETYEGPILRPEGWYSNIGPANRAETIASDMVSFDMPGWGIIDPFRRSDGTERYPNLGNWAVIYTIRGKVTNSGTYAREVSVNLRANPVSGAAIAYRGPDGVWRDTRLSPGTEISYYTFIVPACTTVRYRASYVLGGPSGGNLLQSISLNN